jgi:hypothetical protein
MNDKDTLLLNRRRILYAALLGGGGAALSACAPREDAAESELWAGFDERITERTLAEAEKLFGLEFTQEERRLILGGPVETAEEGEEGFFEEQIKNLNSMRSLEMPNSFAPALTFDPRIPGVSYSEQPNTVALHPEEIAAIPDDPEANLPTSTSIESNDTVTCCNAM